ncbi:citrate lyase acyl carrier protein [Endozoicomonas euniceicola]|uniref:Citrate lyase acyl carrier protein n=1 Tax=Endozoicomonas euniceicola TaxID=1234143 RepID=A0ABY6GNZ4_9GAMM|nr:citrate lyase acyl carrier protein [Endozoicomonas euniceicola]UYM14400.1 citrate lyase acyl carrier protein [Endozoicomonas euniceicola]
MKITESAFAGSLESSDLLVQIEPSSEGGLFIDLESSVEKQFGQAIRKTALDALEKMGVTSARLTLQDKGALDGVIRARIQAAVLRSTGEETIDWSRL